MRGPILKILTWTCLTLSMATVWAEEAATPDAAGNSPAASAAAPVTGDWKKQVIANLNLNQASFNNWAQGGTDMISWQAGLNARFEEDNPGINWLNTLKLQYGLTYLANQGTQISSDTIDLESTYSWKTWPQVNPYVSLSAQSQFGPGYNYASSPAVEISNFLDPGYFTESAGLKYTPSKVFYTRAGLGVKETVASQFQVPYTVDPSTGLPQSVLTQLGLSWVSELNLKLSDNSNFGSKLDTFWPGGALDHTVAEWDNLLSVSLNKIISLNVEGDFRYESKVYPGWQVKETLGIGFAYSLL
ncbi:MAG TPA: DUF3078 domain-containing protein [bacterium]|nr:DUF3078 domain-containing protein [bacterium]